MRQGTGAISVWAFAGMVAVFLVAPLFIYPIFLMNVLCFAIFACAFNLLIGYAGLLSFGHAAFLGTAAYITGHAAKGWGLPPELAILAGACAAAVLGLLFGLLAIRRQGIYFAMITLALAQMVYFFCLQAPFTGGEDGIQAIPRGTMFGLLDLQDMMTLYFVVLAIFLAAFLLIYRIIHSPFGEVLKAIRENETRDRLARLPARPLQAHRLRAVGGDRRACRGHQGDRLPARDPYRRALDDVRRSRVDDPARRPRNRVTGRWSAPSSSSRCRTTWRRSAPG